MSKQRKSSEPDGLRGRVTWLLDHHYGGSRSTMAAAIRVSLTGLISVVSGRQQPGRRLIEKIVQNAGVRPAWLLVGEGQPFTGAAIPVSTECLPAPPSGPEGRLADGVPELVSLYSPSRYWLELRSAEPAARTSGTKLREGDLMLMETDRSAFPPVEVLTGRWGVVRVPLRGGQILRLAELTYVREGDENGPARLEAETFVRHPLVVRRTVVDEYPDGRFDVSTRKLRLEPSRDGDAPTSRRQPWTASVIPQRVEYEDVVAVCALVVRRFGRPA